MSDCARRSAPGFVFYGHFLRETAGVFRSSGRGTSQRELRPLRESGKRFFDNSKAGKFTPITPGRLRSAGRSDGVDYYKFCSSMLSSAVDLQGELTKAEVRV